MLSLGLRCCRCIAFTAAVAVSLGGCTLASLSDGGTPAPAAKPRTTVYDKDKADQLAYLAKQAVIARNFREAEQSYRAAIVAWPAHKRSWTGLAELYRSQSRKSDYEYARFFAARMDWATSVGPLVAASAFQNAAKGRTEQGKTDERVRKSAGKLVKFFHVQNQERQLASTDQADTSWMLYVIPSAILTGAATAVLAPLALSGGN